MTGAPLVTVLTCTVYPDVARVWHACVRRAFPADEARIEIFHDSDRGGLDPAHFPGAAILPRTPARREYHDAYNDAVARVETPYLAFVDSDVFWISEELWPFARRELAAPRVAAVSLVSRHRRPSHGTFAVVMKVAAYREVFAAVLPAGFFPAAERPDAEVPFERWEWHDTGDLATQAVRDAGWELKLLHRDSEGLLVRFHGITLSRRGAEHVGGENLARLAGPDRYFFRGYAGNLTLRDLHDRLFPAGPPYDFPLARRPLLRESIKNPPREIAWRLGYLADLERGARRVAAFAAGGIGGRPAE
jgi:hypothetical protein